MAGIDREVNQIADAYRGNPEQLQQKYALDPKLVELMALNKLTEEKRAAERQIQMQMQNNPATIKQQREQELTQRSQQEVMQRVGPTMNRRAQQQQQQMQQAPQQAQQAQQGIAALQQQMQQSQQPQQQFNRGGIVQHFESGKLAKSLQQRVVDLLQRGMSLDEIIEKAPELASRMQANGTPVNNEAVQKFIQVAREFKGTEFDPDAGRQEMPVGGDVPTLAQGPSNESMDNGGFENGEREENMSPVQKDEDGKYRGDPIGFLSEDTKQTISDTAGEVGDFVGGMAKKGLATLATPFTAAYDATQNYENPEQEAVTRRMWDATGTTDKTPANVQPYNERELQAGITPAGIANNPAPAMETPPGGIADTMPKPQVPATASPQGPDTSNLEGMIADIDTTSGLTKEEIPQESAVDRAIEQNKAIQGQTLSMSDIEGKRNDAMDDFLKRTGYDKRMSAHDNMLKVMEEDYRSANDPEKRKAKRISAFLRGFGNQTTIGGGFASASASRANQIEKNEQRVTQARNRMYEVFKNKDAAQQQQITAAIDYGKSVFDQYVADRQNTTNALKSLTNQQAQVIEQIKSRVSTRELAQLKNKAQQAVEKLRAELKVMDITSRDAVAQMSKQNPMELAAKATTTLEKVREIEESFAAAVAEKYQRELTSKDETIRSAAVSAIKQEIEDMKKESGLDKIVAIVKESMDTVGTSGRVDDNDPMSAYKGLPEDLSSGSQKYL